ncbi:MAG: hypothetical protein EXR11_01875 [Rhodospirillaceae bacterium]|nr:hypothetical protein [Rhodospirillaceae bacterium]
MKTRFKTAVGIASIAALFAGPVHAQDTRLTGTADQSGNLTIGTLSPTYGMVTLPVAATDPLTYVTLSTGGLSQDFAARYSTSIYGSEVGVFARFADRPVFLTTEPRTAFNLGASVGYAGLYVAGGFAGANDTTLAGNFQSSGSWQAGLGYGVGWFDLRLTYSIGDNAPAFTSRNIDTTQWMLGGMYQVAPWIRFNADAFTGSRLASPGVASASPGASTPQGTGARVGVQLRF